jgi:hypothetical protein
MALSVSTFRGGVMKEKIIKKGSQRMIQQNLFGVPDNRLKCRKFVSVYRVSLVKDESISFGHERGSPDIQVLRLLSGLIVPHNQDTRV